MADFSNVKRILIKIGSALVTKDNRFNNALVREKANEIAQLAKQGKEIVIVSSGAVALGMEIEKLDERPADTLKLQLLSGKGQVKLVSRYADFFSEDGIEVSQVLLTHLNFRNKGQMETIRNILEGYINDRDIPIINENDCVAKDEFVSDGDNAFSDNDGLAALVALLIKADAMLVLTNVDGLYDQDPLKHSDAKLISDVKSVTKEIEEASKIGVSRLGLGGMHSKVIAARKVTDKGIDMIVGIGKHSILDILEGKAECTVFYRNR